MDQLEVKKFLVTYWQDIAFGAFTFVSILRVLANRSLANQLKRHEAPTWEFLGRPELFGNHSTRAELSFDWYTWARTYKNSKIKQIRILGDLKLACSAAMWTLALAIIMFGDLNRYNHLFFGK
jgi:hypothetical protein